jgi:hypothetical protein
MAGRRPFHERTKGVSSARRARVEGKTAVVETAVAVEGGVRKDRHPLLGALKGLVRIPPDTDLTRPTWLAERRLGRHRRKNS